MLVSTGLIAQPPCSPTGNQTSFGTGNTWIGYMYNNLDFTSYRGFINQGSAGSPNFDFDFGGENGNFTGASCNVDRTTFSVRFKLRKTFTNGNYRFVIGGDDGYRFSADGGSTWVINNWNDHAYTTSTIDIVLNGSVDLVLEYYENGGSNRVSFNMSSICSGTENTTVYGSNNTWNGYVYDGTNFDTYAGMIQNGAPANPDFDQNFGGSNVTLSTSGCGTTTETFSVRYRLRKNFLAGTYQFTVGADDGYRLSLDGGATWIINQWLAQSYASTISMPISLNGDYDMVLEYYEQGGDNRVTFDMAVISILPIYLADFKASVKSSQPVLNWTITTNSTPDYFEVERSYDNRSFSSIGIIEPVAGQLTTKFSYTDKTAKADRMYYRLKMVDIDRTATYSKTLTVNLSGSKQEELQVYPTILTGKNLNIRTETSHDNVEFTLVDLSGRIVLRQQIGRLSANSTQSIDLRDARSGKGVYLVQVQSTDGLRQTQKIILQ